MMRKNSGQVALVALLVMTVLLTVGLAAATRSITDIRISTETEESARAFSAAEAGIEDALRQDLSTWTPPPGGITVGDLTADVSVKISKSFETARDKDEVAQVNLDGYGGTQLLIAWADAGLELALIYNDGSYKVARWFLREGIPCGQGSTAVAAMPYLIDLPVGSPLALRVRPLCAGATVTVSGVGAGNDLPEQSYIVRSEVTDPETGQTRVVEVTKSLPALPAIFDYVLFSGGDLVK